MIVEYFTTAQERAIEENYIRCEFGGVLNAKISNADRLQSLGAFDDLVVANASVLESNGKGLISIIDQLLRQGVKIHFVKEGVVLCPRMQASHRTLPEIMGVLFASLDENSSQSSLITEVPEPIDTGALAVDSILFNTDTKH
jgi:hypothetical protein